MSTKHDTLAIVERHELSDHSEVYDVVVKSLKGDMRFGAVDKNHADALAEQINKAAWMSHD